MYLLRVLRTNKQSQNGNLSRIEGSFHLYSDKVAMTGLDTSCLNRWEQKIG
jgi:hypothetical protein